ncbi:diacylglycerol kinase family lipid kinase [Candidatus Woesearchaeota archaeon]|nr:diacylglycerol kinase family lipid kinase [Candidatus Woesearchaeota archaeon]
MKALLIVNPAARDGNSEQLKDIQSLFLKRGHKLDMYITTKQNDATKITRKKRKEYHVIIAAGGDGTINEVVNGLATTRTPLGIIPLGTENVLARELHIPLKPLKAAKRILKKRIRAIDVGLVNNRYFTLMAGVGFDAHVASRVEPLLKKVLGSAAYPLTAFRALFEYQANELLIKTKKCQIKGYFCIVGNTKGYGWRIDPAYRAKMDDGKLDVLVFQSKETYNMFRYLIGILLRFHTLFPDVKYFTTDSLEITARKPVVVHVDCETIGTTPVRVSVAPQALRVIC